MTDPKELAQRLRDLATCHRVNYTPAEGPDVIDEAAALIESMPTYEHVIGLADAMVREVIDQIEPAADSPDSEARDRLAEALSFLPRET